MSSHLLNPCSTGSWTGVCVCVHVCGGGVGVAGRSWKVCMCVDYRLAEGAWKINWTGTLFFIAIVTQPIPGFRSGSLSIMPPIHSSWEMHLLGYLFLGSTNATSCFWCSCSLACLLLVLPQVARNKGRAQAFAVISLFVCSALFSQLAVNTPHPPWAPHIHSNTLHLVFKPQHDLNTSVLLWIPYQVY